MSFPVAIQLFSVRDNMENAPEDTLRAIKEMGYDGIETYCGTSGLPVDEYKSLCDSLGLDIISAHVSYELLCKDPEGQLELYEKLGTKYIALPYMLEENRPGKEGYPQVAENIKKISLAARSRGIQLLYHNHEYEFEKINGRDMLEYQTDLLGDKLLLELDTCWVKYSGENPADYLRRFSDKCPCLHLKDYVRNPEEKPGDKERKRPEFRPVGSGIQDIPAVLQAARETQVQWLIVEQDSPSMGLSQLESAQKSIEYIKSVNK